MKFLIVLITFVSALFSDAFLESKQKTPLTPEQIIKQDFASIDTTVLKNFIPFRQNDKWGYMDRVSKKVIITPKYKSLSFFNPCMEGYYGSTYFAISTSGEIFFTRIPYPGHKSAYSSLDKNALIKVVSSANGYKGFTVDANGELESYSDLYRYYTVGSFHMWNVYPFKDYQGKQLAVAVDRKGMYGVIDTKGNVIKGFEFKYKKILWNRFANDPLTSWFFINMEDDKWSLMSLNGQHKFEEQKIFTYPMTSNTFLGLSPIFNNGNYMMYGIFDCREMKWVLKPQHPIAFRQLLYSSDTYINHDDLSERKNVYIYYALEQGLNTYYIDLEGTQYIPQ